MGVPVRGTASFAALALAMLTGLTLSLSAAPSAVAADSTDEAVSLPYLGTDTRPIPDGWEVTSCPRGDRPDLVSLTCQGSEITFRATDFDRGLGLQKVQVAFSAHGVEKAKTYRVRLEAPELAVPAKSSYRYPLPQGTPTTIPYTAFRYTCQACTKASPQFRAGVVSPARAGSVRFSGTGAVFSPAPDFSGRASLGYRLRDRFGQQTSRASVRLTVVPGTSHAPTMVATSRATTGPAARTATGDAMARDIAEKGHPAILTSCGTPFHGTVTCKPDGSFVYTADEGFLGVDEFGYHVFVRRSGDQSVGAVLVAVGSAASSHAASALRAAPSSQRVPPLAPLTYPGGS